VPGVHGPSQILRLFQPKGAVEELLLQGVHRVVRYQIIQDYREGCKECTQELIRILEFAARTKLRKDRYIEKSKGRTRVEVTSQKSSSGGLTPIVCPGNIESLNGQSEFSKGKASIFHGPSDLVDLREG
jgi:hypothetical protein